MRQVARPLERHELSAGELRKPRPGLIRPHGVVSAVNHEHRAADPVEERADALLVLEARRELGRDERLSVGVEAPADRILVRLRRVRLAEALREEELEEVLVVLEPVVAVPLPPADVVLARLHKVHGGAAARHDRR